MEALSVNGRSILLMQEPIHKKNLPFAEGAPKSRSASWDATQNVFSRLLKS